MSENVNLTPGEKRQFGLEAILVVLDFLARLFKAIFRDEKEN